MARRMLLAMIAVIAVIALGCSSQETPAVPADPQLAAGQVIYNSNCANCHGASGGGGVGPKLAGRVTEKYPNIADQIALIANGKGGMPGCGKKLNAEQLEQVALYTRSFAP